MSCRRDQVGRKEELDSGIEVKVADESIEVLRQFKC